jgi:hypothetical protein
MPAPIALDTPALCWRGNGDTWEIYFSKGRWHWRRTTPDGELSGQSQAGHPRKRDCFADALAHGMSCAPA